MTLFYKLKIWQKVLISLIFPIIILLGISIWSFQVSNEIFQATNQARNENFTYALLAQKMDKDIIQIQQWLTDISATRGQNGLDDGFAEAESHYQSFLQGYEKFKEFYTENHEMTHLQNLEELKRRVDAYYAMGKKMAQGYISGGPAVGNQLMGEFDKTAAALTKVLVPFRDNQVEGAKHKFDSISKRLNQFKTTTMILTILAVGLSLILCYFSIIAILATVRTLKNSVEQVAASKDLTLRQEALSKDEIGKTQTAFNSLLENFSHLIHEIQTNSVTLSAAIHELSATTTEMERTAHDINRRTESTAAAMTESTVSLKELAESYRGMSERIQEVNKLANIAEEGAQRGRTALSATEVAMEKINESSQQIVGIGDLITEIGGQTNLLSLNASIEAAKAGDYGKGFAVVAEEVKQLSEKSSTYAAEIRQLVEISDANVKEGAKVIAATGEVLNDIIQQVSEISRQVTEIVVAMKSQGRRTIELTQAASAVNEVTQNNSLAVSQLTQTIAQVDQTTNSLHRMAESMNHLVETFKV